MKRVIIVGGGIGGITTAYLLSKLNYDITILEKSPSLGGRTKSFYNSLMDDWYDNGQHLMIRGYEKTITLLEEINALNNFSIQNCFKVNFINKERKVYKITFSKKFEDLKNILLFKEFTLRDKFNFLKFFLSIQRINEKLFEKFSALNVLKHFNQSDNSIKKFWSLFIESTMNTTAENCSGEMFLRIVKKMFIENPQNTSLVIPKFDLTHSLILPFENLLRERNVKIYIKKRVNGVEINKKKLKKVYCIDGSEYEADFFIFTIPMYGLSQIFNNVNFSLFNFSHVKTNPIISVHIWFNREIFDFDFCGLLESSFHWVFNNKKHITLIRSAADELVSLSKEEIFSKAYKELMQFFPQLKFTNVVDYKIIKEKRATFVPSVGLDLIRPNFNTEYSNFFLGGDFVNTGLPSTIESAIESSFMIFDYFNNELN